MILHAKDGAHGFTVFHVPTTTTLKNVVWVDDVTMRYATLAHPICCDRFGNIQTEVHQAKKIRIFLSDKLVLIDPVDDSRSSEDVAPLCDLIPERI